MKKSHRPCAVVQDWKKIYRHYISKRDWLSPLGFVLEPSKPHIVFPRLLLIFSTQFTAAVSWKEIWGFPCSTK